MKRFLLLLCFAVPLAMSQVMCATITDCEKCNSFQGFCKWCGSGSNSAGCVEATQTCPLGSSSVSVCPISSDWCESAQSCFSCLSRANGPTGKCSWCESGSGRGGGCRSQSRCPTNLFLVQQLNRCGVSVEMQNYLILITSVVLVSASVVVGLILGAFAYAFAISSVEPHFLYRVAVITYVMSYFFWGAIPFSVAIAFRASRLRLGGKQWSSSSRVWIVLTGVLELLAVLAATIVTFTIDAPELTMSDLSDGIFPASLLVSLPTVWGALLIATVQIGILYNHLARRPSYGDYQVVGESIVVNNR